MSAFLRRVQTMPRAEISLVVIIANVSLVIREDCVIRTLMNVCYLHARMEPLAETK